MSEVLTLIMKKINLNRTSDGKITMKSVLVEQFKVYYKNKKSKKSNEMKSTFSEAYGQ